MPAPELIRLYAVVPADEAHGIGATPWGVRPLVCGPIAAVVGKRTNEAELRAAVRHDRIVGRTLTACSSVVPFRLAVEPLSEVELHRTLELNRHTLSRQLARFRGRVEMGLKARLGVQAAGEPMRLPVGLERVHALAPGNDDRRQRLRRAATGPVFEGCYLISRQAVAAFWSAVQQIRRGSPDLPVLGSGPWAAYSFCDFALRSVERRSRVVTQRQ